MPESHNMKMTHSSASMSNSSATVLAANTNRRYVLLQNIGGVDVWCNFSATAVANTGFRLDANGGIFEMNSSNIYMGIITGITGSGTTTVLVTEGQ